MNATEALRARIEHPTRWRHRKTAQDLADLRRVWRGAYRIEPAETGGWQAEREGWAGRPPVTARTLRDLHIAIRGDWIGGPR